MSSRADFRHRSLSAWIAVAAICLVSLTSLSLRAQGVDTPRLVVLRAPNSISVGGDSNNPAVWIGDRIHVFSSPFAQNDQPAGVASAWSGPSVERLDTQESVAPDRSFIDAAPLSAVGPWFESVIADDQGVLWAYYHAEFGVSDGLHPRIGSQVSYDAGATWHDLGVIINTPGGSDAVESYLGFGFVGGNGDFTAVLDRDREYVYFIFSQYGAASGNQGVAVARMRWADRADPVGKVWKRNGATWDAPGLGGSATPLLANAGDAHGVSGAMDFWWGPSVHWNYHLGCYVMLLNRSTRGDFTSDGPANWVMFGRDLADPNSWSAPVPIAFPEGFNGGWYPVAIGTEKGDTDRELGHQGRLFVAGSSGWRAIFLRPGEELTASDYPTLPDVAITADNATGILSVTTGTTVTIASVANDLDGDMLEHWLELRSPSGQWSWEGWLTSAPWDGALGGDGHRSAKSVTYTFNESGEYLLRSTAVDLNNQWVVSNGVRIVVSGSAPPTDPTPPPSDPGDPTPPPNPPTDSNPPTAPNPPPPPPQEPPTNPGVDAAPALPVASIAIEGLDENGNARVGSTLVFRSVATDVNGDMLEHWLELHSPELSWSWEGWLTTGPWLSDLVGNGSQSNKSASFTFTSPGSYVVRASAVDTQNQWITSSEVSFTITGP